MKVTMALIISQVAFSAVGAPEDTVAGKLRVSILSDDGATVIAAQDVDDSNGDSTAVFTGIAAGNYIASAQRLTGDEPQANLGSPCRVHFVVGDQVVTPPPGPKTFGQPTSLIVTVEAE